MRTILLILLISVAGDLSAQATKPAPAPFLPGVQRGLAPWTNGVDGLTERLAALNLPAMPKEEFAQHIHQFLTITVRGKPVTVPAGIGINQAARYISPIHTHDTTGVIHIESATLDSFTLGQFFDVWGVRFSARCIGGYCTKPGDSLRVTVNGGAVKGDPRKVELKDREEIGVAFGK